MEVHDDHQVLCSCSFFIFHFSFSGSRLRLLKLLTGVEDAILQFLSPAPFLELQINGDEGVLSMRLLQFPLPLELPINDNCRRHFLFGNDIDETNHKFWQTLTIWISATVNQEMF